VSFSKFLEFFPYLKNEDAGFSILLRNQTDKFKDIQSQYYMFWLNSKQSIMLIKSRKRINAK